MRSIYKITLLLVDPVCQIFHRLLPPTLTLYALHLSNYAAFFLFISMPPKKRKQTDTNRPKGIGRLHLEEIYAFDAEQLTSDFVLTHGHIWYYLVTHQFDIHETTTLLKPLYNSVQKSKEKCVLYCIIVKLSNEFKRLRGLLACDRKLEDFKELCKELFVCPSDIPFSDETLSTSQKNTVTTTLLTPHATPVKVLTEDISSLLSTPAKTRHQKQVTVAKNARRNLFLKDRQVSFWKNKYRALATSMRANVVRSIKEKLQRRNRQIDDLKLKLTPTRTAVRNERKRQEICLPRSRRTKDIRLKQIGHATVSG